MLKDKDLSVKYTERVRNHVRWWGVKFLSKDFKSITWRHDTMWWLNVKCNGIGWSKLNTLVNGVSFVGYQVNFASLNNCMFYRGLATSLCELCNAAIKQWVFIKDWIYALPLLHFLRGDTQPFAKPKYEKDIRYDKWKWWGLEGISVRKFIPKMPQRFDIYSYCMIKRVVV